MAGEKFINDNSYRSNKIILLLTDGEDYVSDSVLQSSVDAGVKIYTIGIGSDYGYNTLQHIADYTGGEFYIAKTAEDIVDIYSNMMLLLGSDLTTDTDGDGLPDIFETVGMRLSNGEIIYTDPLNRDTDGDGLSDGEEIKPQFKFVNSSWIGLSGISCGVYFEMNSDPTMKDTDGDGIPDNEDTATLEKGLNGGIIGELTIVSMAKCDLSGINLGHSFLVYKSYIDDELDFSGFHSGYGNNNNGHFVHYTETGKYNIKRNKYVTIGLYSDDNGNTVCGNSTTDLFNTTFGNPPKTSGGISYNWELYNYYVQKSDNQKPNAALSKQITQTQLNWLIKFAELNNYYSLLNHNCTIVALYTWDLLFGVEFSMTIFPYELKKQISCKKNSFELDMEELLQNM